MKLPAIQFYPGDWQNDIGVQSLSFHDKGVWFEILLIMHQCEPRGKLAINGVPIPLETLGKRLGLHGNSLRKSLRNLQEKSVISFEKDTGIYYSRRMVRDDATIQMRRRCGALGGNPKLINKDKQKDKQEDKENLNQTPTPSVSSSSLSLTSNNNKQQTTALYVAWNEMAKANDLPVAQVMTKGRIDKCKARLKEHPLDYWLEVFSRISRSAFCRGQGTTGWRATFDWIIHNADNSVKVMEGKYDDRQDAGNGASPIPGKYSGLGSRNASDRAPLGGNETRETATVPGGGAEEIDLSEVF